MSIFENFVEIDGKIVDNSWIEWWHISVPNKNDWVRKLIRGILALLQHCMVCTALDGCYFLKWNMPENKVKKEDGLLHPKCDCEARDVDSKKVKQQAKAICPKEKFSNYIFSDYSKGKKELFESWGLTSNDIPYLIEEYCAQARGNYLSGNYILKTLDKYGQRLSIPVTLKEEISFYTGWMLCPEGELQNTTPFGGWIK